MVIMSKQRTAKEGFVILIAVLVSSLMVSIGAFIASIAVKELALSSSGRDSQTAFYAADAALECALYQDLRVLQFAASSTAVGPTSVYCNGQYWSIINQVGDADSADTFFDVWFQFDGATAATSPFARVKVHKENIGTINDKTVIDARGYNIADTQAPSRTERALRVEY